MTAAAGHRDEGGYARSNGWFQCDQIGRQILLQKLPKYLVTFRTILETVTFQVELVLLFSGNLWNKLGYFLFQHLVTLVGSL